MKLLFKTIVFCLLAGQLSAQTQKEPSLKDLQQQMLEMQRQLLQQFQQFSPGDTSLAIPEWKWDTTFSFHVDTLGGQGMGSHFFFSPFGQDSTFLHFFGDQPPAFNGTNPFGGGFQWSFPPGFGLPDNDENSALDDPGDGLLPEERLRKESEGGEKPSEKQTAPASKKTKIKTIRI